MWLPKQERKLLAYYYSKVINTLPQSFDLDEVSYVESARLLKLTPDKPLETANNDFETTVNRLKIFNILKRLVERGLIKSEFSMTGAKQDSTGGIIYRMRCISLTNEGYDLGRKYNHWFTKLDLWYKEYGKHPLLVIAASIVTSSTFTG